MINSTEFGRNAVINSVVSDFALKAKVEKIDFNYNIISPPLLSMNDEDLKFMLLEVLNSMFVLRNSGIFLNINVFSGKMQFECKSLSCKPPNFINEQIETILNRNDGMLKSKFCNNEFILQIVFPV